MKEFLSGGLGRVNPLGFGDLFIWLLILALFSRRRLVFLWTYTIVFLLKLAGGYGWILGQAGGHYLGVAN